MNFYQGTIFNHALNQLVRIVETKSSLRNALLTKVEISFTADSAVEVSVDIRDS
jgi:hypothetical protein